MIEYAFLRSFFDAYLRETSNKHIPNNMAKGEVEHFDRLLRKT